jgi:hypothetical protein
MDCDACDENEYEAFGEDWWQQPDIMAVQKGKGKGNSKRKGKGFQGSCYNCGEYGHSARNCTQNQTKGKGKGEKGKGKSWTSFSGYCYECGGYGHTARQCSAKGKGKGMDKGKGKGVYEVDAQEADPWETWNWNSSSMNLGNPADKGNASIGLIEMAVNSVQEVCTVEGNWEKIKVNLDSGAIDWVTNPGTAKALKTKETAASREGRGYRAANGTPIRNYGEKVIDGFTSSGDKVQVAMQVADVNKTLGSAFRMNQCGMVIVIDGDDSYFRDSRTGKITKVKMENGQYVFDIWVKAEA